MDATEVLDRLAACGVMLIADGERLRFRPRDAVTPDLRAALVAHKAELVRLLDAEEREVRWRAEAMRPQIHASGPIPFLVARRPLGDAPGACLSCAESLGFGRRFRCGPCVLAAERVLNEMREGS